MGNNNKIWGRRLLVIFLFLTTTQVFGDDDKSQELESLKTEIQALQTWKESVHSKPVKAKWAKNRFYFRGGYMQMESNTGREGELLTDLNGTIGRSNGDQGFYFGASFDFSLSENLWGLSENTELMAELMFEYQDLSNLIAGPQFPAGGGVNPLNAIIKGTFGPDAGSDVNSVEVTQFILAASPKIKFMKGHDFRPWILPAGFALHIISPPSNGFTLLTPGIMFGAGFDYNVWKNISLGMDGRYHWVSTSGVDGVNLNGFTAGFNLGFGF